MLLNLRIHYFILLGASACAKLNRFDEAIAWCDKGLAVSLTIYFLILTTNNSGILADINPVD